MIVRPGPVSRTHSTPIAYMYVHILGLGTVDSNKYGFSGVWPYRGYISQTEVSLLEHSKLLLYQPWSENGREVYGRPDIVIVDGI